MKFILHKALRNYRVPALDPKRKPFTIRKGQELLKIEFEPGEIHMHRGKPHLDLWGEKLERLRKILT
jgi:hypothetical protein